VALRYLATVATTLRPGTVELRADSLITFAEYLADQHPAVHSLTQLTRAHIEDFLAYNHRRPWRGRVARPQPVSASASKRTVIDLRCFFDDLALWDGPNAHPGGCCSPTTSPASTSRCHGHLSPTSTGH
jgi:site-specific recombinase XerD